MAVQMTSYADLKCVEHRKHPVKLTALLYLREALMREDYESCPELIEIALEFKAKSSEIHAILEDPRRVPSA